MAPNLNATKGTSWAAQTQSKVRWADNGGGNGGGGGGSSGGSHNGGTVRLRSRSVRVDPCEELLTALRGVLGEGRVALERAEKAG